VCDRKVNTLRGQKKLKKKTNFNVRPKKFHTGQLKEEKKNQTFFWGKISTLKESEIVVI
jgi:hypothetical protein